MRKLSPVFLATAVVMALASTTAVGQLRTQAGSAVGTNGSTATTSTSGTRSSTGATVFSSGAPSETITRINPNVRAPETASASTSASGSSTSGAADANGPAFNTSGNNNAVGSTGNFAQPGALLGVSPGQTSAGTAGATSAGLGVTGDATSVTGTGVAADGTLTGTTGANGLNTNLAGAIPGAVVLPGATVGTTTGFAGGVGDASGINANGERVGSGGADFRAGAAVAAPTPTPLFNQAAARGAARDAARRARGDEPRIIGLAPRTERDLTHQMPNDPIIRY